MNSEELEKSLATEFEIYLKGRLADFKQEAMDFQVKIENEFDKQKAQFDEAFNSFTARFDGNTEFGEEFKSLVAEHLNLARDDGAKLAANAMAEAEKLEPAVVAAPIVAETQYDAIRDAVNDISSHDSQSTILKSLVHHAEQFAPRGAFFIIKNEHFEGWKVFGGSDAAESAIRDIHFSTSSDSILSSAVGAMSTTEGSAGSHSEDSTFLEPLDFGSPDQMIAIPLVVRGRSVAVLYTDHGHGGDPNREALETLVRVAGLTVELHASAKAMRSLAQSAPVTDFGEPADHIESSRQEETWQEPAAEYVSPVEDHVEAESDFSHSDVAVDEPESSAGESWSDSFQPLTPSPVGHSPFIETADSTPEVESDETSDFGMAKEYVPESFEAEPSTPERTETAEFESSQPQFDEDVADEIESFHGSETVETVVDETETEVTDTEVGETEVEEPEAEIDEPEVEVEEPESVEPAIAFDSTDEEEAAVETSPFEMPAEEFDPAEMVAAEHQHVSEPAVETVGTPVVHSRLSDRNVDLPIEVADDERRFHNDARRFARLLVSEIKLYNEKKVLEGRTSSDLYERLREAIDRSREMYNRRVQPPVAAKFDYFHYELVSALAEGDAARLGSSYPGATV